MKKKVVTASVLCLIMLLNVLAPVVFAAEADSSTAQYAELLFESKLKCTNLTVTKNYLTTTVKGGRTCALGDKVADQEAIYIDIDDKFMYDLPADTPVDVIVEYFDSGAGKFNIFYDSHTEIGTMPGTGWQNSDDVYLEDTGEWRTATFHLEDLKATNKVTNGSDFRISLWDPETSWSKGQVAFSSIRVQCSELKDPVNIESIESETVGNVYAPGQESVITATFRNKTNNTLEMELNGKIVDEKETHLGDISGKLTLDPKATDGVQMNIKAPEPYGLYRVLWEISVKDKVNPKNDRVFEKVTRFSVSIMHTLETAADDFGVCSQFTKNYGEPDKVADVMVKGGLSYVRDDSSGELINGKWYVRKNVKEKWKKMHDAGINVIVIFFGSPTYGWNVMPTTDYEMDYYAKFCADLAEDLKGIVNIFEIWNEPNLQEFNATMAPPATYIKMAKKVSEAVKERRDDVFLMGPGTTSNGKDKVDTDYVYPLIEQGGLEYLDAISFHPYGWSDGIGVENFIDRISELRQKMNEYGGEDKEIWLTELGFSATMDANGYQSITREDQGRYECLMRATAKAYDLWDVWTLYCLFDRESRYETEHNWGLLNYFQTPESSPYSAKESYLMASAFTDIIGNDAKCVDKIRNGANVAYNFYDDKKDRNILYMQSDNNGLLKNFDLGCESVTVYDTYGNKVADLKSDTGIYSFVVNEEQSYIVGKFTKFEETDKKGPVSVDEHKLNAAAGGISSINFTSTLDKNLVIEVDGADVVENNGFEDGKAVLKINVPNAVKEELKFNVTVKDEDGNVYFLKNYIFHIVAPVTTSISSEHIEGASNNRWRIKVELQNLHEFSNMNGVFTIHGPDDIKDINMDREFKNLGPGEKLTLHFNIPEKVIKEMINLDSSLVLENGYSEDFSTRIGFTIFDYAYEKPVIDGENNGEYNGNWFGATKGENYVKLQGKDWQGPQDLSFSGTVKWDEDNLYFYGITTDDIYSVNYSPAIPINSWMGDNYQIGISDKEEINPVDAASFTQFSMAALPDYGAFIYREKCLYNGLNAAMLEDKAEIAVKRFDTYTATEVRIPWDEIFYEGYKMSEDKTLRFSLLANENDGGGRLGYLEYGSGIGTGKDVRKFFEVIINK